MGNVLKAKGKRRDLEEAEKDTETAKVQLWNSVPLCVKKPKYKHKYFGLQGQYNGSLGGLLTCKL